MSPTTATELMTADQFYDWANHPDNAARHYELERGRVVEVSRPGEAHGFVAANFARVLGNYAYDRKRGYVCSNDTGILWERDPDTVRGPDVVFYDVRRAYEDLNPKYGEEVPTIVVEVLSPNDRIGKVNARIAQFLGWGVALLWLADPEERTLTIYRRDRAHRVLKVEEELTGEEVLPDLKCRVADFFYMPGIMASP